MEVLGKGEREDRGVSRLVILHTYSYFQIVDSHG